MLVSTSVANCGCVVIQFKYWVHNSLACSILTWRTFILFSSVKPVLWLKLIRKLCAAHTYFNICTVFRQKLTFAHFLSKSRFTITAKWSIQIKLFDLKIGYIFVTKEREKKSNLKHTYNNYLKQCNDWVVGKVFKTKNKKKWRFPKNSIIDYG